MTEREASCSCGQLTLTARGEPSRVSVCHCLACQRRTGSAFGVQARFAAADVQAHGAATRWRRAADDDGEVRVFSFCPDCGATVFYTYEGVDDVVAVPVGAFADPGFPGPSRSIYEDRAHHWVPLPDVPERHS